MNGSIYQLKLTLKDSKPPIWRRIQVSGDISLHRLHKIIQAAMGWLDYHLYQFTIANFVYGIPDPEDDDWGMPVDDSRKIRLNKLLSREKTKIRYEYDFGDGWVHHILVEKIIPPAPGVNYPVCLAGKRACPPEDCGGIWGYEELLDIIGNPRHKEYKEMMEWLGGSFDAEEFDLESINEALSEFRKSTKTKRAAIHRAPASKQAVTTNITRPKSRQSNRQPEAKLPLATICFYGPDDITPTKVTVGIITAWDKEPADLKRWWGKDVVRDRRIQREITDFISAHNVQNTVISPGIIGCPHEEGIDFPIGEDCPFCTFWKGKQHR